MISIVAAVSRNGVIGKDGGIPWDLPEDMAFFKRLTMGGTVIMGRKTYESIGHPLLGRKNIIISSRKKIYGDNCITAESFEEAIKKSFGQDVFVCGGCSVYEAALKYAHRLYITEIDADFSGDTFFPYFDKNLYERTVLSQHRCNDDNKTVAFDHVLYTRKMMGLVSMSNMYDTQDFIMV